MRERILSEKERAKLKETKELKEKVKELEKRIEKLKGGK
ncbi:hypothetical protein LCGC14_0399380 [marine sediment metagenome]|uniref:Uncharacterized protein n=1 Tax=marine sediment metagenome TaxID=412755 RepID=A0A0F9TFJ7_9ZZZZ